MKKHFSLFLPACDFTYMYLDLIGSDLFMGIDRKNYASWAEKITRNSAQISKKL